MRRDNSKKEKTAFSPDTINTETTANTPSGDVPQKRSKRYKNKKKRGIFKKLILICFLLCLVGAVALGVFVEKIISSAPEINPDNLYELLAESTIIYDADGNEIDTVYSESNRENVEYEDLPKNLINAVVALEDKTFWTHHGFNYVRILGAIKDKIVHGGAISGTSTITQQLARNLYLKDSRFDHDYRRKIIEAYYSYVLEKELSKEEILLAYLNTIDFGYHSSGVQAAANAYFSKDVKDLNLSQCVALAALPQAPTSYQLIEFVGKEDVDSKDKNILKETPEGYWIANEASYDRRMTCLKLMLDQEYISEKTYKKVTKRHLRNFLDPNYELESSKSAYFADYVINEVIDDLMEEKDWDYDTAYSKVYNGGVKIYSTLDSVAQDVIETEFENDYNFPDLYVSKDSNGNILNTYGGIALYDYDNYFDSRGRMNFKRSEAKIRKDGSLLLYADKRLHFYYTEVNGEVDYSVEFSPMYVYDNYQLYSIGGGYVNIPQQYKSLTKKGNLVISKEFLEDEYYKDYFKIKKNGKISLTSKGYTLEQRVVQPQAAMAIVENSTGYIKALVGGRMTSGRKLHNRATSPRQPGSSMKPLGVYSAAIQQSAEEAEAGQLHSFTNFHIDKQGTKFWGNYITPSSIVIDEKTVINGEEWPHNAGGGNTGPQTLRTALQQSLNTCAVKIFMQVGADYSSKLVQKYGISTLETEGETNDINAAALALGGMSRGVTPLDMASAYTTFPNNGVRYETTAYRKVKDNNGKTLLSNKKTKKHRVLDSGVAWIMCDMLKSVVTNGLGWPASISGVQSGGKTGTTDNQVDVWFDGFTPSYSAALWIGNDQNFQLTGMSEYAARLWGRIMDQIPGAKEGYYKDAPSNVSYSNGDYCIAGTAGGSTSISDLKKKVKICKDTNYLATSECTNVKSEYAYSFDEDKLPKYYCFKHNTDVKKYPISPKEKLEVKEEPKDDKKDDSKKDKVDESKDKSTDDSSDKSDDKSDDSDDSKSDDSKSDDSDDNKSDDSDDNKSDD